MKRYRRLAHQSGFTLVELLVTIAIIGVLMTVGIYVYSSVAAHSRNNTRKTALAQIENALQQHYLDWRDYPVFDYSSGTPIYSAAWQLTGGDTCQHTSTDFLVSRYITAIPEDPLQQNNLTKQGCTGLTGSQTQRYLYITNTTSAGPASSPTMFGLLATLENPTAADVLSAANNPLLQGSSGTNFGSWYGGFNNYGSPAFLTANYMITGTSGR